MLVLGFIKHWGIEFVKESFGEENVFKSLNLCCVYKGIFSTWFYDLMISLKVIHDVLEGFDPQKITSFVLELDHMPRLEKR